MQTDNQHWDSWTESTIWPDRPYYFENVLEELDAPGEWCLDAEEGMLY